MKVSRNELEKEITGEIEELVRNKRDIQTIIQNAKKKFGIPPMITNDYITLRKDMTEADNFVLYILADILLSPKAITHYFTDTEIKTFSKTKWHVETVQFPLKFDMTRINDEQYIGCITAKKLMLLKDAQLINYNENAQRTMKRIIRGEMEYYQIALNKDAVYAIMESYESDIYIPNAITLNLPEDADFVYDDRKKQLIIQDTDYLDILDGYHRYIAMSKIHDQNPDFDYEMELRIVQFTEDKAKRFIWQEDQKTKMRKIDSESMDSTKLSNKIVDRLNNDGCFVLSGMISRNKGIINAAYLANIIDVLYLSDIKKSEGLKAIKNIVKRFEKAVDDFTEEYPEYLEKPWDKITTFMLCYEEIFGDLSNIQEDIKKVREDGSIYHLPNLTKADVTRTHKLLGREGY